MKKFCFLLCLIMCISTLAGCVTLPTTPTDNNTMEEDDVDTSTQTVLGSDKEIVLKENHPKYLDDAQTATSTWENEIIAKKVIVSGQFDSVYADDHIIMEISTSDEDVNGNEIEYISAVDIYFYRFDEAVSFEDALNIVATYLPEDKIQQYFEEEMSVSEPTDTGNEIRYAKFYELKDASDSDIPQISDSFGVMVWVDENGNATEARINYVVHGPFDDETMDVWDYNYFAD